MKNNSLRHITIFMWLVSFSLLTASCGLLDMEFDEGTQMAYEMRLNRDTVTVLVGDTFVLAPIFVPDSVSNHEVFFVSGADSVATVKDGAVVAMGEGETVITAISVSGAKRADCQVYVMAPWTVNPYDYSDDMIVYTTAAIGRQPFDPETQQIGAFSGSEFRGMGQLVEWQGRTFLQFRIYGHYEWGDDEPTQAELIRFARYDKEKVTFEYLPLSIPFDGETHGSPSEPLELDF